AASSLPRNYHFIYQAKNWTEAQRYCRENFIDLATVADVNDMWLLYSLVDLRAWFGLYRNNWRWSDDSTMSYTSWNKKYPAGGIRGCVAAGFKGPGGWEDWMCDAEKVFVCYSGNALTNPQNGSVGEYRGIMTAVKDGDSDISNRAPDIT
uniref:C-type lectin domain-containing protein n=1 Tax=Nothobranchius furzeri TaxID=105023 RepID=A0A8C6PZ78_NOTFU